MATSKIHFVIIRGSTKFVRNGHYRAHRSGHSVADTTDSRVAAITEVYGPALMGKDIFDVPTGPGLGVTIDEQALKKHTLRREIGQ